MRRELRARRRALSPQQQKSHSRSLARLFTRSPLFLLCHRIALYLSNDGGQIWRRIGREGRQTFGGYFHPKRPGWIYMTLTEGAPGPGLWLSRDQGQTWQSFPHLPFANIQRITFDPSDIDKMYVTTFGGSVWRGPVVPGGD